jgi:hypothetical protein
MTEADVEEQYWRFQVPRGHKGLDLFVIAVSAVLFSGVCSAQVKLHAELGAQDCREVNVPGAPPFFWSVDPATANKYSLDRALQPDYLMGPEFRAAMDNPSELYFAAIPMDKASLGPYSNEKYAISVPGDGAVRPIDKHHWYLAQPLRHSMLEAQSDYHTQDDDNKNVVYNGTEFPKSGEHLSAAIVSLAARWIAVFSYDGKQLTKDQTFPGTIGIPGRTKHPRQGELYSDIFEVKTGQKMIALRGSFQGQRANNWFLTAFFLEDRYFFLNTGEHTDQIGQFWLCALPGSIGK